MALVTVRSTSNLKIKNWNASIENTSTQYRNTIVQMYLKYSACPMARSDGMRPARSSSIET